MSQEEEDWRCKLTAVYMPGCIVLDFPISGVMAGTHHYQIEAAILKKYRDDEIPNITVLINNTPTTVKATDFEVVRVQAHAELDE